MARNSVAANHGKLASNMTLPGMLRDSHVCKYCPHLPQCSLAHKYGIWKYCCAIVVDYHVF